MTTDEIINAAREIERDLPRPRPTAKILTTVAIGFVVAFAPGCWLLGIPIWVALAIAAVITVAVAVCLAQDARYSAHRLAWVRRDAAARLRAHGTVIEHDRPIFVKEG